MAKSDRPIEVSATRDDSMLVISVADRGAGLEPGEETKVFQKFYRGPRTRPGGIGLGLSIARQLVEANGGQIVAQNRQGGGAVFSIRLPIVKQCDFLRGICGDVRREKLSRRRFRR